VGSCAITIKKPPDRTPKLHPEPLIPPCEQEIAENACRAVAPSQALG
jgi:hypothetical protein